MTNGFASKTIRLAGSVVLACMLATSVGAQNRLGISLPAPSKPEMVALFFDIESAALTPEAKTIVLSAVDAAERAHAQQIVLAAYAAPDESARDPELSARRAAAVKQQIADFGFQGLVVVDEEAPDLPLVGVGADTFDRSATLRLGG
jgi:hypothetical protein